MAGHQWYVERTDECALSSGASVGDDNGASRLIAQALMPFPEDEDPIDGAEHREQEIANERLPEAAGSAAVRVDTLHPEPPFAEALPRGKPSAKR